MSMLADLQKTVFGVPLPCLDVADTLPAPCACGCPLFWSDHYGGQHCFSCQPPPAAAMIASRPLVIEVDGRPVWSTLEEELAKIPGGFTYTHEKIIQAALTSLPLLMLLAESVCCPE